MSSKNLTEIAFEVLNNSNSDAKSLITEEPRKINIIKLGKEFQFESVQIKQAAQMTVTYNFGNRHNYNTLVNFLVINGELLEYGKLDIALLNNKIRDQKSEAFILKYYSVLSPAMVEDSEVFLNHMGNCYNEINTLKKLLEKIISSKEIRSIDSNNPN